MEQVLEYQLNLIQKDPQSHQTILLVETIVRLALSATSGRAGKTTEIPSFERQKIF